MWLKEITFSLPSALWMMIPSKWTTAGSWRSPISHPFVKLNSGITINICRMQPAPLQFNVNELDSFRYRVEDVLRSVTNVAVKEMRNAEIKKEILNSEKLKSYFAENPGDLKVQNILFVTLLINFF